MPKIEEIRRYKIQGDDREFNTRGEAEEAIEYPRRLAVLREVAKEFSYKTPYAIPVEALADYLANHPMITVELPREAPTCPK